MLMLISFDYLLKAVRNHLCTGCDLYDIPSRKVGFVVDEGPGICVIVRISFFFELYTKMVFLIAA
jgi:hypothetical protein